MDCTDTSVSCSALLMEYVNVEIIHILELVIAVGVQYEQWKAMYICHKHRLLEMAGGHWILYKSLGLS